MQPLTTNISKRREYNYNNNITSVLQNIKLDIKDLTIAIMFILFAITALVCTKTIMKNNILQEENVKLTSNYNTLQTKYSNLEKDYNDLKLTNEYISNTNKELRTNIRKLNSVMTELDTQNKTLVSNNEKLNNELTDLRERKELYDKYSYALYDDGVRNDITFDNLKTAEKICKEAGIDTNLILATIMVESAGNRTCTNSASTARGFGQLLKGTGAFTYETIMGNGKGTYNHEMAFDGNKNIEMTINYFAYLKKNTSNIYSTINRYRGLVSPPYQAAINKYLKMGGTSLEQINRTYY